MKLHLARHWWLLLLRGIAAIAFGITAWVWPHITLDAFVLLFGLFALFDGGFSFAAFFQADPLVGRPWPLVLEGALGFSAAAATVFWPAVTALVLIYVIAAWMVVTGVVEMAAAWFIRRSGLGGGLWMLLFGAISCGFGAFLAFNPGRGGLTLAWLIGLYAIIAGILLVTLSIVARYTDSLVILDDASLIQVPDTPAGLEQFEDFRGDDPAL